MACLFSSASVESAPALRRFLPEKYEEVTRAVAVGEAVRLLVFAFSARLAES